MRQEFIDRVKLHEGYRSRAYQDSVGVWTIGYGRNLQELEIDEALAEEWLTEDLDEAWTYASWFPEWRFLNEARQEVLAEMVFNMGPQRVARFRKMLAAIALRDWKAAKHEMLDSKWARQVGQRAHTLAKIMEEG